MKKFYLHYIKFLLALTLSLFLLHSCSHKTEANYQKNENKEENDGYDSPDKAAEFELNRTKDPATGKVPTDKMWAAVLETESIKRRLANAPSTNTPSTNALTPLTWIERGSNSDAVGPGNGNTRPGNGVTSGRVRAIWVDKADATGKTVWIGGVDGGVWKTNDITASLPAWNLVNDFLSNLAVTGICQDPTNTNTMYFCTGEAFFNADAVNGNGVFKSIDHGVTWALLPSTSTLIRCSKILCDAAGNVYVSTIGIAIAAGLQRSTDGGTTWTSINPFTTTSRIVDFEISSTGAMHVSGGLNSAAGIGGYRFTNNPAALPTPIWLSAATPFIFPFGDNTRTELACSGNTVYASLGNTSAKIDSIAKSTDGGNTWTTTGLTATNISDLNGGGLAWYSQGLAIDPSDPNTLIVGSLKLLKSTDGGSTFSKISEWVGTNGQYVHADVHNISWYDNGNKLIVGCDGGIFYTANKGTNFSDKNTGLRLKQFYGVAIHPSSTNYFLCGAQDNGTHQFNGPGLTSSIEVLGGDGGITAIDQDEPLFQTGAFVYSNFRRTADGGSTWFSSGSSSTDGQFINPYDFDNLNNKVYAGYSAGNYLRWEDPHSGFTFTPVPISSFSSSPVTAVAVSPYTSNRVYFGTGRSSATTEVAKVIRVDNADQASPASTDITPSAIATNGYVNSVNVGSSDQNLIVTLSNYNVTNIWSSTNGGTSWVACDGNLPNMPVYWALFHPDGDTKAYIATETGVWSTDLLNGISTIWTPESSFPTVKTEMLKYRSSDRTIAAATHGRGLWTSTIPVTCTPASISKQPSSATICAGSNISFTVAATGTTPLAYQWQVSTDGAINWNNIINGGVYSNATTSVLTITGATVAMNAYQYRIKVTGNCNPLIATSSTATLTVNPLTVVTGQPANSAVCTNGIASFSVVATGSSLTYQWQENIIGIWTNITNGGIYSGATTNTLTLTGVTAAMNSYQYRSVIGSSCSPVTSNAAILTVNPASVISSQPVASSICAGSTTSFSVTAIGTTLSYQWQENANGTWVNINNGGIYSNATTAILTLTGVTTIMNNNQYRVIVSGAVPCGPIVSNSAILTVTPQPVITLTASPGNKLFPGRTTTITANTTGFTTWTRNGNVTTANGNSIIVGTDSLGLYTAVATIGSCTSLPASITISDSASNNLFIYSNPNNGRFTVAYNNPGGNFTTQILSVYNSAGALVYTKSYAVLQPYQLLDVDMRKNAAGVYYVVLSDASGKRVKVGKVVIR